MVAMVSPARVRERREVDVREARFRGMNGTAARSPAE